MHRSKGLEFPIVYLPEAWDRYANGSDEGRILRLHEPTAGELGLGSSGECVLDVGGRHGPGRPERFSRYREEEAGEDLRLLYVALTRAQCQVVTWWAPSFNTPASALHRFASRRPTDPASPQAVYPLNGDPFASRELGPGFSVETMTPRALTEWQPITEPPPVLRVRGFDRELDLAWRRTSYSALTAAAHGADAALPAVGSEPELTREDDESAQANSAADPGRATRSELLEGGLGEPSPMHDLPSGVEFGTAVHAVFERVDRNGSRPARSSTSSVRGDPGARSSRTMTADALASALLPSLPYATWTARRRAPAL